MTAVLLTLGILYALTAAGAGCIFYLVCNPYGHISRWSQFGQSVFYGVFWLPVLLYVAWCWWRSGD